VGGCQGQGGRLWNSLELKMANEEEFVAEMGVSREATRQVYVCTCVCVHVCTCVRV
jgi:hypothetical protein